jgi:hypothetical protein
VYSAACAHRPQFLEGAAFLPARPKRAADGVTAVPNLRQSILLRPPPMAAAGMSPTGMSAFENGTISAERLAWAQSNIDATSPLCSVSSASNGSGIRQLATALTPSGHYVVSPDQASAASNLEINLSITSRSSSGAKRAGKGTSSGASVPSRAARAFFAATRATGARGADQRRLAAGAVTSARSRSASNG